MSEHKAKLNEYEDRQGAALCTLSSRLIFASVRTESEMRAFFFLSFFLPKICKRNNQTGRKESASAALIRMSGHVCVCAQGVRVRGASMEAPARPCDEAAPKVRTHAAR